MGNTDSNDFPTNNPLQVTRAGSFDAFICKISLSQLDNIEIEVNNIEAKLDNPNYGLESIKNGISVIENVVNEINVEVNNIKNKLADPNFGLKSIKDDIAIKAVLYPNTLTTGVVVKDANANSIVIEVLNDTTIIKTVTIYVYNLMTCPKTAIFTEAVNIKPNCSITEIISCPPLVYEVRFTGIVPEIYAWTSTRKELFFDINHQIAGYIQRFSVLPHYRMY